MLTILRHLLLYFFSNFRWRKRTPVELQYLIVDVNTSLSPDKGGQLPGGIVLNDHIRFRLSQSRCNSRPWEWPKFVQLKHVYTKPIALQHRCCFYYRAVSATPTYYRYFGVRPA